MLGWLSLGVSVFASLADASNAAMALPLTIAGLCGLAGLILAGTVRDWGTLSVAPNV
jgi:hypothetical protein